MALVPAHQNGKDIEVSGTADSWALAYQRYGDTAIVRIPQNHSNLVTLGPLGEYTEIEAALILVLLKRMSETPEGMKHIVALANKYMESITKVLVSIHASSATNWMNNLINQMTCLSIYRRMGLMSAEDALQTKLYLDHVFGEALKKEYVMQGVTSLTTLVNSAIENTKESEGGKEGKSAEGLAAIAKILGPAAGAL